MMLSSIKKYLFIANPKTGSTAVETFLKECDPTVMHNRIPGAQAGEIITGIHGHISARNLKKRMGNDYDNYKSIVFVRNPYGKSVSAYFFYKQGDLFKVNFKNKGLVSSKVNNLLARLLPFSVWCIVKPMKTNSEYISDASGKIIVNHIGKTENLNEDILRIAEHLGLRANTEAKPSRVNQSKHSSDYNQYFRYNLQKKLFDRIYRKDLRLYEKLSNFPANYDWKGEQY